MAMFRRRDDELKTRIVTGTDKDGNPCGGEWVVCCECGRDVCDLKDYDVSVHGQMKDAKCQSCLDDCRTTKVVV